jgi:transcriptional regulator with XRE-family HTH domain
MNKKKKATRSNFHRLRVALGLSREDAARLFEVSVRTINNWDRDEAPGMALKILALQSRDLGAIHPDWAGFKIGSNGKLYGPGRLQLSAEHVRRYPLLIRQLEHLEAEQARPPEPLGRKLRNWLKEKL